VDDIQEFLSGRDKMAYGTKARCEVARTLTEIYYSMMDMDRHERWMEKRKARENKRRGKGWKEDGGGVRKKRTIHGGACGRRQGEAISE
jgi:hypothetical protein